MRIVLLLAAAGILCAPGSRARAAEGFDAQIHRPIPSTTGTFSQESGRVLGRGDFALALTLDYARNVLVLRDPGTNDILPQGSIVGDRLVSHLGGALGLFGFLEARVRVPVFVYQDGTVVAQLRPDDVSRPLPATALGDLELLVKARLFGAASDQGFKLAVATGVTLPTGSPSAFTGDDGVGLRPRLVASLHRGRVSIALNAGYNLRPKADFANAGLTVDDELAGGLGLGIEAARRRLWLMSEVYGARGVRASRGGVRSSPSEAVIGVRAALGRWFVQAGVGVGLTTGVGAPAVRGLLAVGTSSELGAARGAPSPAAQPVVAPRPEPPPDRDRDGLLDRSDRCPTDPEDTDGFEDEDGCPDPDNDKDGIADVADRCPADPEDRDDFEDQDGCPDPDNDKDGIADVADRCPVEAEVWNGSSDEDGCADPGPALVSLTRDKIEIAEQIHFAANKATIKKDSFVLLATVARMLVLHPEILRLRVEGHTDNSGKPAKNTKLSQARAEAVRKHLVEVNGIDAGRLEAAGFGPTRPIDTNKTKAGRTKNRRVELVIVDRAPSAP